MKCVRVIPTVTHLTAIHPPWKDLPLKAYRISAFTLLELLIVIAIIAVLAAIIVPVVSRIQAQARSTKCLNQLRQIGLASRLYANDNEQTLPFTSHQRSSWTKSLQPYASGTITFLCPCDEVKRSFTYTINDFLTPNPAGAPPTFDYSRLSRLETPSQTILFGEASKTYANSDHFHFADYYGMTIPAAFFANQVGVERHAGSANYLFADAHVEALSWKQVQSRLQLPGTRFVDPTAYRR